MKSTEKQYGIFSWNKHGILERASYSSGPYYDETTYLHPNRSYASIEEAEAAIDHMYSSVEYTDLHELIILPVYGPCRE
jgi:hypothetical protein